MAGELWVGEALLWHDVHLAEPLSRSWNVPRLWLLPDALLRPGGNTLWVRVVGVAAQSPGLGALRLGAPQALQVAHEARWWRQRTLFALNLTLSVALGVLFFFIWLLRRKQRAFGWYALMTLCWVLFIANVLVTETWPFPDTLTAARANASMMVLYVACFGVFIWRFGEQHWRALERSLWALVALLVAALWAAPAAALSIMSLLALLTSAAIFLGVCVQFIAHALRTRQTDHLMLAACLAVYVVVAVHDVLVVLHLLPDQPAWTPFSSVVTMVAMSAVLGWRIAQNTRRIERFNDELQVGIAEARAELGGARARAGAGQHAAAGAPAADARFARWPGGLAGARHRAGRAGRRAAAQGPDAVDPEAAARRPAPGDRQRLQRRRQRAGNPAPMAGAAAASLHAAVR